VLFVLLFAAAAERSAQELFIRTLLAAGLQ